MLDIDIFYFSNSNCLNCFTVCLQAALPLNENLTDYIVLLCLLQQAALVLNASRRFRYTLDLKKEEEKKEALRKIRAHAQAIRVSIY